MTPNLFIFLKYSVIVKTYLCLYSRREPEEPEDASKGRDVFNEKPPADELMAVSDIGKSVTTSLPENVVSTLFQFYHFLKKILVTLLI